MVYRVQYNRTLYDPAEARPHVLRTAPVRVPSKPCADSGYREFSFPLASSARPVFLRVRRTQPRLLAQSEPGSAALAHLHLDIGTGSARPSRSALIRPCHDRPSPAPVDPRPGAA